MRGINRLDEILISDERMVQIQACMYQYSRAIYRSIKDLVEVLDPSAFWQIHRGTIVNIRHVSGISRDYRGRLSVKLRQRKETLPVSAPYAHLFKQM